MEEKHIGNVNGMEIWVFEENFGSIPHCHLISSESGLEAEISIMDWSVIGGTLSNDEHDAFMKWLDEDADDNPVYSRKVDVIYYYQLCNQACNEMLAYYRRHMDEPIDDEVRMCIYGDVPMRVRGKLALSIESRDKETLHGFKAWIYDDEDEDCIPHCHLVSKDGAIDASISLIDMQVINGELSTDAYNGFMAWIAQSDMVRTRLGHAEKAYLYWDGRHFNNRVVDYVRRNGIDVAYNKYLASYMADGDFYNVDNYDMSRDKNMDVRYLPPLHEREEFFERELVFEGGGISVYVCGPEDNDYPPHCHVITEEGKAAVSLLDWSVLDGKIADEGYSLLLELLGKENHALVGRTNKEALWIGWDSKNPYGGTIAEYYKGHLEEFISKDIIEYAKDDNC